MGSCRVGRERNRGWCLKRLGDSNQPNLYLFHDRLTILAVNPDAIASQIDDDIASRL